MKKSFLFIVFTLIYSTTNAQEKAEKEINSMLDNWHKAAAEANYLNYFNLLTDDSIFIGTDATENWTKPAFQAFAKPYFEKGKAWSFTALERHIYFNNDKKMAWFNELLNTQMKICRGSGVLILINGNWKIKHYVLSMTIPNDTTDEVIKIKAPIEDALISTLKENK